MLIFPGVLSIPNLRFKGGGPKVPEYDVLVTNPPYSGEHVVTWMCVSKICEQCKKEVTLVVMGYTKVKQINYPVMWGVLQTIICMFKQLPIYVGIFFPSHYM